MADFWRIIDSQYFALIENHKLAELRSKSRSCGVEGVQQSESYVPYHFSNLVDKIIKSDSLFISADHKINQLNKQNFIASSYVNAVTYGNLMVMKNKNMEPCSHCISNFESIMIERFDLAGAKCKTSNGIQNYLKRESRNLEKCVQMKGFGFCDKCLKVSTGHHQTSFISSQLRSHRSNLAQVQQRSSYLINLITKRCRAEDKLKFAINVSLENNLIKQYLFSYLIELEQKLLVDNVFNIVGKVKNFIMIEFIRIQGVYVIDITELKAWNKYREASLFKMHKCGFKYYNPYYSFNVI